MARQWYEKAAAQGRANALYTLGEMYAHGQGRPQDFAKARQWYEKAASPGQRGCEGMVRKAAAQGDTNAQFYLGSLYETGGGVPRNYAGSDEVVRESGSAGNADAQFSLGLRYAQGYSDAAGLCEGATVVVSKRLPRANAGAQYKLGQLYHFALGVPQNYAEALKWYEKAAAKRDADAQIQPRAHVCHWRRRAAGRCAGIFAVHSLQSPTGRVTNRSPQPTIGDGALTRRMTPAQDRRKPRG